MVALENMLGHQQEITKVFTKICADGGAAEQD